MKFISKFERYLTILYIFTIITLLVTSYFTFKEVINSYNKNQHQSIIPLFSIVNTEIIRPLNIAHFIATDPLLIDLVEQDTIDKTQLLHYLKSLSAHHKMTTFIALEKHDLTIDSEGKTLSLSSEKTEWYHRLKAQNLSQFADIGNADNPHLYFDIKITNANNEFLGFSGVAIDLNHFADKFAEYKKRFGFELIFVDHNNEVTLSSNDLMKTESHHRKNAVVNIEQFSWYQNFVQREVKKTSDLIITINDDNRVISQMPVQSLNWRMFIISPPASQQEEYWQLFLTRMGLFFLIIVVLYFFFITIVDYFKNRLVANSETDFLTQLPNRSFLAWKFEELVCEHPNVCVVIADIDHFKQVNDQYGHNVGDAVLVELANQLHKNLRREDISGRWGGEEFVMLLPDTSELQAVEIIDRLRANIAKYPFKHSSLSTQINLTVSFGLCFNDQDKQSLEHLISCADKALYRAKALGRNRTEVFK